MSAVEQAVTSPVHMRWCRSAVVSRCFSVVFPDGAKRVAMVPVVDMLDHDPDALVRWEVHAGAAQHTPFMRISNPHQFQCCHPATECKRADSSRLHV